MTEIFRYFGFGLESEYNESPAPAAQFHLDLLSSSLDAPTGTEVQFEGSLGRAAKTHRPGFYSPAGNAVVAVDVNTVGWFLLAALGGYDFTTGPPNTHEVYGVNNALLPSFAARVGKDLFEHVFSGCILNSVQIQVNDGFVQLTADVVSAVDGKSTLLDLGDLILPDESPLMFHEVTSTRDASDVSAEVKQFTITINNSSDAPFGRTIGSRHPRQIVSNARAVTVSAELLYKDTAQLEAFWGDSDGPSADGTTEFGMDFVFNAGSDGSLTIAVPRVIYDSVGTQPSGRTQMTQNVEMTAYQDEHSLADATTVDSEILCTLSNAADEMVAA